MFANLYAELQFDEVERPTHAEVITQLKIKTILYFQKMKCRAYFRTVTALTFIVFCGVFSAVATWCHVPITDHQAVCPSVFVVATLLE
jgi:hypothetical protein